MVAHRTNAGDMEVLQWRHVRRMAVRAPHAYFHQARCCGVADVRLRVLLANIYDRMVVLIANRSSDEY